MQLSHHESSSLANKAGRSGNTPDRETLQRPADSRDGHSHGTANGFDAALPWYADEAFPGAPTREERPHVGRASRQGGRDPDRIGTRNFDRTARSR